MPVQFAVDAIGDDCALGLIVKGVLQALNGEAASHGHQPDFGCPGQRTLAE